MKKKTMNYRQIAMCLLTVLMLGFSNEIFAGNNPDTSAGLKYIGVHHNQPVFRLDLNNSTYGEYTITIRDSDRILLLSEKLKGKNIIRKYQADADELSLVDGTTFEVTNVLTKETAVYKIGYNTSFIENTVITKL